MKYFAYGSNLNLNQMAKRCPNAVLVGKGILYGYKLDFRYYLSISRDDKSQVPIGIWEIDEADEKALDAYEGFDVGLYDKYKAVIEDENGEPIEGLIYVMARNQYDIMPSDMAYLRTCAEGYDDFNLEKKWLYKALDEAILGNR